MQKLLALIQVAGAAIAGYSLAAFMANQTVAPAGIEIGGWTPSQIMNAIGMLLGGGGAVAALIKQLWPQAGPVIDSIQQRIEAGRKVTPEYGVSIGALLTLKKTMEDIPEAGEPLTKLWGLAFLVDEGEVRSAPR